jgi:hypothetical protein
MSEILSYLNSPHLVASFQKVFGVEPEFSSSEYKEKEEIYSTRNGAGLRSHALSNANGKSGGGATIRKKSCDSSKLLNQTNSNGTITLTETKTANSDANTNTATRLIVTSSNQAGHRRTGSNGVKKQLVNVTDHSHLIANTTIHSRFLYVLL